MTKRGFYNYILFDGGKLKKVFRKFKETELAGETLSDMERIQAVMGCAFYIGKGRADRSLHHFKEAKDAGCSSNKAEKIREIWKQYQGIIIHQFFNHSTSFEASTREAILIDFIGKHNLTNERKGTYYGKVDAWGVPKIFNMGFYYALLALKRMTIQRQNEFLMDDIM